MKRRFVYLWIGIGLLILFAFLYLPGLSRYYELHQEEVHIEQELAKIEREIQTLQQEKKLLQSDRDYIEKVIREELGLVRPGEMVYKLVPEKKTVQAVKPSPEKKAADSH